MDVLVSPQNPDLRIRHVVKSGIDCYFLFNEGQEDMDVNVQFSTRGRRSVLDIYTGNRQSINNNDGIDLARHELKVFAINNS